MIIIDQVQIRYAVGLAPRTMIVEEGKNPKQMLTAYNNSFIDVMICYTTRGDPVLVVM